MFNKRLQEKLRKPFVILLSILTIFTSIPTQLVKAESNDWNISLNWGDLSESLPNDYTLSVENDGNYTVKLQVTVKYTGNNSTTYKPGDVQISLSDIYDLTGLSSYELDNMLLDVGAEEVGSGSGKGDWYYTRTFNETTKCNDYVFTNKSTINTSFTSTFQLVFTFSDVREFLKSKFTKKLTAKLTTPSNENSSNELTFNYVAAKDLYEMRFLEPSELEWPNTILSLIDSSEWDDYIFVDLPIEVKYKDKNAVALQEGYHLDLTLPEDIIAHLAGTESNSTYMSLFSGSNVSKYNSVDGTFYSNILYYALALPREEYLKNGTVTINADWFGTYISETNEQLVAADVITINVNDFDYIYSGELYSHIKEEASLNTSNLFREVMEYGYGLDTRIGSSQSWDLSASAVYYGKPYNMIIGDDLQYFVYEDNTFRKLNDDEFIIDEIEITNPTTKDVDYEVWAREVGKTEYELIKRGTLYKNYKIHPDLSTDEKRYCSVYVKLLNIEETIKFAEYFRVITRAYDNRSLDNNKKITDCYNVSYLSIEIVNDDQTITNAQMIEQPLTNIAGMAADIMEQDGEYNDIRLRGIDSIEVDTISYHMSSSPRPEDRTTSSDEEYIYLKSGIIHEKMSNYALIETDLQSMRYKFVFDSNLKLDLDGILYSPFGNDYWSVDYSKEYIENKDNVVINYELTENNDGTTTLIIDFDLSNSTIDDDLSAHDNYLYAVNLAFYTSLDDYYMLELEGKNVIFRAYSPTSNEITNEITGMNYTYDSVGYSTVYLTYPSVARNSYQGVDKLVANSTSDYGKDIQKVNFKEEYSYKLRIRSSETQMSDIVLYDQLESELSTWKGTFNGVSFEGIEKGGIDTSNFKVYYSLDRNQECDLSASGWVLSTNWTNPLSDVKAIAIDFEGYVMPTDSVLYVEVNMIAPSYGNEGDIVKNTSFTSYVEYDSADTDLNVPLNTVTNLPSNITSLILGDTKIKVNVVKRWDDQNNELNLRPENITVRLLQDNEEIDSLVLSASNNWNASFDEVLMYDERFKEYEYTIVEETPFAYESEVTSSVKEKTHTFTITNHLDEEIVYTIISGTKTWDDNNNAYKSRPESITLDLYQNDVKVATTTTNESLDWKYSFGSMPKYMNKDVLYEYRVEEHEVLGYSETYNTILKENGLAIHFSNESQTESNYDFVHIYYRYNGQTYSTRILTGDSIAGKTVYIPSYDFYLSWYTDGSVDSFYGFKIDSITPATIDVNSLTDSKGTIPSYEVIEMTGDTYPESQHNGYGNNRRELYHYSFNESLLNKSYDVENTLISLPENRELTIGKIINADEIWWPHGNPIFFAKVEGTDALGNEIVKYVPFEFTQDYVEKNQDEANFVAKSTTIKLPAGTYTVSEVQVLRYQLINILTVNAASFTSTTSTFDLVENDTGKCTFVNECTKYQDYSHNDIVVNVIE